jgi:adenosylmethionine---8-amino-7-oxononanoate aminotransferase
MTVNPKSDWLALGGENIWLPYKQMKTAAEPLLAVATQGSRIRLKDGRELIDGVASWWTACHGYNHPHILAAMRDQMERMPHVMFDTLNHEPALRLAKRWAALLPGDLERVFFVDSGSVAVELALKMAVQYWINKGQQGRTKFVSFRDGYHGDTLGCMAVCDPEDDRHKKFGDYVPKQFLAELPEDEETTEAFDKLLSKNKNQIAAVIIEPLVQGVGGMKFHDAGTLRRVSELCTRHEILLIADEIFTGFGRTGTMFACEQAGVVPDIMCLGKALSACTVTLAATVARRHVFEAFWSDDPNKALMHGPTYMANPLACAAANASLDLFEREPRLEQAQAMEAVLLEGLAPCRSMPGVIDVRVKGAIGVIQFAQKPDHKKIQQHLVERGVWIRGFGKVIPVTPPLNMTGEDANLLTKALCTAIKEISE